MKRREKLGKIWKSRNKGLETAANPFPAEKLFEQITRRRFNSRLSALAIGIGLWPRDTIFLPLVAKESDFSYPITQNPELGKTKLTLPTDTDSDGEADEVSPAQIKNRFEDNIHFYTAQNQDGQRYTVYQVNPNETGKTPETLNIRSESREMNEDETEASWNAQDGVHTMEARLALAEIGFDEAGKEIEVSLAQIHDGADGRDGDDRLQVRTKFLRNDDGQLVRNIVAHFDAANLTQEKRTELENAGYVIDEQGKVNLKLIENYQLGEQFNLKVEVINGAVAVYLDGNQFNLDQIAPLRDGGNYFKIGNYTQNSEITTGKSQVNLYENSLKFQHQTSSEAQEVSVTSKKIRRFIFKTREFIQRAA